MFIWVSFSFGFSGTEVIINNTGQISISNITAKSGYWRDIQDAVNWVVAHSGIGNVYIPEGTWNFINIGESWTGARVTIPAGVNVFGAPTEKYANGTVKEWKTVLVMPSSVWSDNEDYIPAWFKIVGNSEPNKSSRFSDIKLVGYRSINNSDPYMHYAIEVENVIDFRIDHCYFEHTTAGVSCGSAYEKPTQFRGVIDHCFFVNHYGVIEPYEDKTIGYGVSVTIDWHYAVWDSIEQVLGHYNNYTVFIEDCYFEKWRHCVCANNGGHYVFRHNIIKNDFGFGSLDLHEKRTQTSARAAEIYENQFLDSEDGQGDAIWWRGGGGVAFNNTVSGYKTFAYLVENAEYQNETFQPHDIWIWNNSIPANCILISADGDIKQDRDYFLNAPSWYTPYPYPHPFASG
jgi:hypothetical protein